MDLRLRALGELDPRQVELPHGTEVVTTVARVLGERRAPQGSIGRVVRIEDDAYFVAIVGLGTLRYARDELVPRRVGQVAFAERRALAWEALRPCTILESTVGSRAWGLADEESDTDVRGVFVAPFAWTTGLLGAPEDLVSADGSTMLWSAGKAVRQALRADPNTLETLFVPSARATDEMGQWLLAERDAFVSREIHGAFGRYAVAQLRRLEQGARLAEHRAVVLEWLRAEPMLALDEVARRLASTLPRAFASSGDAVLQAKQYTKQLYRSMFDQGLLAANDFAALVRFAVERSHAFDLPRELRPKNAYNLLRLIATARAWLENGTVDFVCRGPLRERLLAIKRGEVAIADILAEAEAMAAELDDARARSPLPVKPDLARADALLRRIHEEVARRHVAGEPGPLGADAPAPPEVGWTDEG